MISKRRSLSLGKITNICENYEFFHSLGTKAGSSGSPICLIDKNNYVIGIHRGKTEDLSNNVGTFIGIIIDKIETQLEIINNNNIGIKDIENYNSEEYIKNQKLKLKKKLYMTYYLNF